MVSRKDIEDFYKKYKKNLDAEAQVIDRLLQAEDQEIWLELGKRLPALFSRRRGKSVLFRCGFDPS